MFRISDGVEHFDIDTTKIDVYVNHRNVTFDEEGNNATITKRYDIRECREEDFNHTDAER